MLLRLLRLRSKAVAQPRRYSVSLYDVVRTANPVANERLHSTRQQQLLVTAQLLQGMVGASTYCTQSQAIRCELARKERQEPRLRPFNLLLGGNYEDSHGNHGNRCPVFNRMATTQQR